MKVSQTDLNEVLVLEYEANTDNRGTSSHVSSKRELEEAGILTDFVEETSYQILKSGTIYGIHFQNNPQAQTKLLFCTKGRVLDFAVDLRRASGTFREWVCVELSPENRKQLYIPAGFGHALLTLEECSIVNMKIDKYFHPSLSASVSYSDTGLHIDFGIADPVLSESDANAPTLLESGCNL